MTNETCSLCKKEHVNTEEIDLDCGNYDICEACVGGYSWNLGGDCVRFNLRNRVVELILDDDLKCRTTADDDIKELKKVVECLQEEIHSQSAAIKTLEEIAKRLRRDAMPRFG